MFISFIYLFLYHVITFFLQSIEIKMSYSINPPQKKFLKKFFGIFSKVLNKISFQDFQTKKLFLHLNKNLSSFFPRLTVFGSHLDPHKLWRKFRIRIKSLSLGKFFCTLILLLIKIQKSPEVCLHSNPLFFG